MLFMPIFSLSALYFLSSCAICLFSGDAAEGHSTSSPASGQDMLNTVINLVMETRRASTGE